MVSPDFRRQLEGYGFTTANIFYRMPDYPDILQSYVWQLYDLSSSFSRTAEIFGLLDAGTRRPIAFRHRCACGPDQGDGIQICQRGVPSALRGTPPAASAQSKFGAWRVQHAFPWSLRRMGLARFF